MKLDEALIERKALKTRMEELKSRIYKSAQIQEGDNPAEQLLDSLKQLSICVTLRGLNFYDKFTRTHHADSHYFYGYHIRLFCL